MEKTDNLLEKISENTKFILKLQNTQNFEEFYEACKELEPNATQKEIKENIKKLLTGEDLDMIAGGKMDFNKFKISALTALILVGGIGLATGTKAMDNESMPTVSTIDKLKETLSVKMSEIGMTKQERLTSRLVAAAGKGDIKEVKKLLNDGADINSADKLKATALVRASGNNQLEMVKFLIKNGADVNVNTKYWTALTAATFWRHTEIVKSLLENGAEVNDKVRFDNTALMFSAYKDCPIEIGKLLIEYGAIDTNNGNIRGSALNSACTHVNFEMVKLLLENNADVNTKNSSDVTALMSVVNADKSSIIRRLIDDGNDIRYYNGKIDPKIEVLLDTIENDRLSIVKLLLENNADVNAKDTQEGTVLCRAIRNKVSIEIVELLLKRDANVDEKDKRGTTALIHALEKESPIEIIKLLLKYGADVNAKNYKNETALKFAKNNNYAEAIKILIEHGANE